MCAAPWVGGCGCGCGSWVGGWGGGGGEGGGAGGEGGGGIFHENVPNTFFMKVYNLLKILSIY